MDQIERSKIAGLILRLLGEGNRGRCLTKAGLQVLGLSSRGVPFRDFAGPVASTSWLWFQGVLLPLADGSSLRILGVRREAAESFTEAVNAAWRHYLVELFDEIDPELRTLTTPGERLEKALFDFRVRTLCALACRMGSNLRVEDVQQKALSQTDRQILDLEFRRPHGICGRIVGFWH